MSSANPGVVLSGLVEEVSLICKHISSGIPGNMTVDEQNIYSIGMPIDRTRGIHIRVMIIRLTGAVKTSGLIINQSPFPRRVLDD